MKGTGIVAWMAAATVTAAAGFAAEGDQRDGVATAVVLPALSATSPSGETRVTVVEGRANTPEPRRCAPSSSSQARSRPGSCSP